MHTATAPRPLSALALGDLVSAVDGVTLAEPRMVIAELAPIRPGGTPAVQLSSSTPVEFMLYADRDTEVTLVEDEDEDEAEPQPEAPAPAAPQPRALSTLLTPRELTLPEGVTVAPATPGTQRNNTRGLSDVQFHALVRALAEGGAVRAHGSCMNALVERGLAAWIDGKQKRPSKEIRGRLTLSGVICARGQRAQDRATAYRSEHRLGPLDTMAAR